VSTRAKTGVYKIEVNYDWCKACELCIRFCPFDVLEADEEGKPRVVRLEACNNCKLCELHCPDLAILVREL